MSFPPHHGFEDWSLQDSAMNYSGNHGHEAMNLLDDHVHLETTTDDVQEALPMIDVDAIMAHWTTIGESGVAPDLPSLEKDDSQKGQAAQVQKFYPGRPKCKCCINWVEKIPQKVPNEAEEKYHGVAIQVYHAEDHSKKTVGSLKAVTPSWVVFQSPIILQVLGPLFKKISGTEAVQGKIQLLPPFQDLFFAYSGIVEAYEQCEKDSEDERHLKVLKEVTDELILETTIDVKDLQARGLMTWQNLWTLFKKGTIVVAKHNGQECLYEVLEYNHSRASACCRNIYFDGTNYGFMLKTFTEPLFNGTKSIRELLVYPIWFHENRVTLERNVLQRSNRVLGYQGTLHAEHNQLSSKEKANEDIDGTSSSRSRIIIDPYAYDRFGPGIGVTRLTSDDSAEDEEFRRYFKSPRLCRPSAQHIKINNSFVASRPHWLLLLYPFVSGYSLRDRNFREFYVDHIDSVKWNDWAFRRIVFAEESKDLLLTLVKSHKDIKRVGQDIIPGKGNGLVVLLSGPPGTGKTLTAESLADEARRPFLRIQAETLGNGKSNLEMVLKDAFRLANEWNALLLIDGKNLTCSKTMTKAISEADAFLGGHDIRKCTSRSSLVRTLMTSLEYYSGLLFLTTNFPEEIDEAFASRIDLHFEYPALDRHARCKLLRNITDFIGSSKSFTQSVNLTDEEIWDLARWKLNGRELKNAVKISSRLCSVKKETLSSHHLKVAIQHTSPKKYNECEDIEEDTPPSKRARSD